MTRTKYFLPRRRADILSRPRLLDILQDLLDKKLIIIAAPAGYGKTSLLVDLAHQTNMPVCWYSVDPLDRELNRFVAYFIASIHHRYQNFGKSSGLALQNLSPTSPDLNQLVTTIVNEAYECIREHFWVILDDYHFVNDQEEINTFIDRFLQESDENCHLVISSRTLLTLPDLPLMVARAQVGGLGFDELSFQPEEIQRLVEQNYHSSISADQAAELARESEGWITGLLLSTQTRWQGVTDRLRVARVSSVGLYDYLAQQVLDQQPPAVRDFLLRTSLLEEFDAGLCQAVLGKAVYDTGETWQDLIDHVQRNNLFVLPIDDTGAWIRYHHLFRDFLQTRLSQEIPDAVQHIIGSLAKVYSAQGEWERAHALYSRLGDEEGLVSLIEQSGSMLIRTGRLNLLAAWIDGIHSSQLVDHPILLSLRGTVAHAVGEIERSLFFFNHAEEALSRNENTFELALTLTRRAHALQNLGRYSDALADSERALELMRTDPGGLIIRAFALRERGLNLYRLGSWSEAIESLKEATALYDIAGNNADMALVLIDLGMVYQVGGAYTQSQYAYERAQKTFKKIGDLPRLAIVMNNLGVLFHEWGDHEKAANYLDKALEDARQCGNPHLEALTFASIGDLYRDLDAPDAAKSAYQQASEIATRTNHYFDQFYNALSQINLHSSSWNPDEAQKYLTQAYNLARNSHSAYQLACCQVEDGRLAVSSGDIEKARPLFATAAIAFQDDRNTIEEVKVQLRIAGLEADLGNSEEAKAALARAHGLANLLENQRIFVPVARELKPFLKSVSSTSSCYRWIQSLLDQADEFEGTIPRLRRRLRKQSPTVPFAPPRLSIRAFGKGQVLVDGKPIKDVGWKSQDARALFFLMLTHADGLSKEQIFEHLWQESPPAQLKIMFKNAIYRLRHALEQEVVSFDGDRYRFNHAIDFEYDVEVFHELLQHAAETDEPAKRAQSLKNAVELYQGPFLQDFGENWIWIERSRLQDQYSHAMLGLAETCLEMNNFHDGLLYCQQLLTKDPCLEEAHRIAMRIHAAMGNKAAIARQYERCQQSLQHDLGLPPSQQTEQLYHSLIR